MLAYNTNVNSELLNILIKAIVILCSFYILTCIPTVRTTIPRMRVTAICFYSTVEVVAGEGYIPIQKEMIMILGVALI